MLQTLLLLRYIENGGSVAHRLSYSLPDPAAYSLNNNSVVFFRKNYFVTVLIDSTLLKVQTVKSLIKLIKPI